MEKLRYNLPVLVSVVIATGICVVVTTRERGEVISATSAFLLGTSLVLLIVRREKTEHHEEALKDKKNPDYYRAKSEEFGREKTRLLAALDKICRALGLSTSVDLAIVLETIAGLSLRSKALEQAESSLALLSAPAEAIKALEGKLRVSEERLVSVGTELTLRTKELQETHRELSSVKQTAEKVSKASSEVNAKNEETLRLLEVTHCEEVRKLSDGMKAKDVEIQTLRDRLGMAETELSSKEAKRLMLDQTLERLRDTIRGIHREAIPSLNKQGCSGSELDELQGIRDALLKFSLDAKSALANEKRVASLEHENNLVKAERDKVREGLKSIHEKYPWILIAEEASSFILKGDFIGAGKALLGQKNIQVSARDRAAALLQIRFAEGASLSQFVESFIVAIEKEALDRLRSVRSALSECETQYKQIRDLPNLAQALRRLEATRAELTRAEKERNDAHKAASNMQRLLATALETPILEGLSFLKGCPDEFRGKMLCGFSPTTSSLFIGACLARPEEFSFIVNDDSVLLSASEVLSPIAVGSLATTLRADIRRSALAMFGTGEGTKKSYKYVPTDLIREILSAVVDERITEDDVDVPQALTAWDVSKEALSENKEFPALDFLRAIEPFSPLDESLGEAVRGVFSRYIKARGGPKGVEIRDSEHGLVSKLNMSDRRLRQALDLNFAKVA